ncbi:CMP/dCMP deaminase zinc-binding protein [Oceaniovalibus guishaninsula JLT2003]|uniref:CMP/dCMP deaminase zinc-binding protein n=2 Tax=Oceaniovalibus TaxID=1207070 RepID=K2HB09_9RHOB|nr:CMP/dCMP deaminase zinc-binding protein [Oceaniovalibus guishaninsula JLT2003]
MDPRDRPHLDRCIALAREALEAGDEPFGSVLTDGDGRVLHEARNRAVTGDPTRHPEFALARWAAQNLTPDQRRQAVVYTSGEHCPMCSAAHAWAGLGRIVYISSAAQLGEWLSEIGVEAAPVASLAIREVAPGIPIKGPIEGLDRILRDLHRRRHDA